MSLIYIAGYVCRNEYNESNLFEQTILYYEKFGGYLNSKNRGGLKIPLDNVCQWVFFCFILFHSIKDKVCRQSLSDIFLLVSEFYFFEIKHTYCNTLANIFLNNYCAQITPRSNKEPALKVLKLS